MIPASSSYIYSPPNHHTSLTHIEVSFQNLVKILERREKLHHFFKSATNDSHSGNISTRFFESNSVKIVTIVLLTLDLILTILELSSSIASCSGKERSESLETKLHMFHWAGIVIICLLLTKSVALAIGLRMAFFKRPGYVLDSVVLVLALILQVGLDERGGGMIVVVSLWRVVRIVEGAFEISDETIGKKVEIVLSQVEVVKEENRMLKNEVVDKDKLIDVLQQELNKLRDG